MESTAQTPVNHRLRDARVALGLSITKTAAAVGCTREHLSKFENGRRYGPRDYSPELIYRLSRFLDVYVPVDEIFEAEIAPLPAEAST
ncbi:MAG TPA: helix-turn-helix transcriptional regulator [Solirubrobacterales bacterium]|nr:helix-turn-helix transcriptional regulator [Solirubrobacterales bacterium]